MRLEVVTAMERVLDVEIARLVGEAPDGAFGMLPRHADYVTALAAGVLSYTGTDGIERFLGIDGGTLVKCGSEVLVSTRRAIAGTDLDDLRARVRAEFQAIDEEERAARAALARLEAGMIRRLRAIEVHD